MPLSCDESTPDNKGDSGIATMTVEISIEALGDGG